MAVTFHDNTYKIWQLLFFRRDLIKTRLKLTNFLCYLHLRKGHNTPKLPSSWNIFFFAFALWKFLVYPFLRNCSSYSPPPVGEVTSLHKIHLRLPMSDPRRPLKIVLRKPVYKTVPSPHLRPLSTLPSKNRKNFPIN